MAVLWERSLIPWIDPDGDPYAGAKAYFFQPHTTTPMATYTTGALDIPHDHPVVADGDGRFPPIFLPDQTIYRLRITTADDVTLWDIDDISSPTTSIPEPPTSETPEERLWRTGDIKVAWRTSVPSGFVRINGRTIGSPTSGATERANDDCEDLFIHLWNEDSSLAVSGGRGASAAGDWAAAKTIALPSIRDTALVGMSGMGNSSANIIPASAITGGDGDVLGARGGAATVTLTASQIPELSGVTGTDGAHQHNVGLGLGAQIQASAGVNGYYATPGPVSTDSRGAHSHNVAVNQGGGTGHNNIQPVVFVPFFIKL